MEFEFFFRIETVVELTHKPGGKVHSEQGFPGTEKASIAIKIIINQGFRDVAPGKAANSIESDLRTKQVTPILKNQFILPGRPMITCHSGIQVFVFDTLFFTFFPEFIPQLPQLQFLFFLFLVDLGLIGFFLFF